MTVWLDPQPGADERPRVFPNPFDDLAPHALAMRCADLLKAELATGVIAEGFSTALLHRADGGKMFGVLVVEDANGRVGFLRALSGQLEREWNVPGYAPPVFDAAARAAVEVPAEKVVKSLTARVEAMRVDPALLTARAAVANAQARHAERRAELKTLHAANKAQRRAERQRIDTDSSERVEPTAAARLDSSAVPLMASRADDASDSPTSAEPLTVSALQPSRADDSLTAAPPTNDSETLQPLEPLLTVAAVVQPLRVTEPLIASRSSNASETPQPVQPPIVSTVVQPLRLKEPLIASPSGRASESPHSQGSGLRSLAGSEFPAPAALRFDGHPSADSSEHTHARHRLDQLSRADDAERRRHESAAREEFETLHRTLRPLERRLEALERLRRLVSREAMRRIWDSYVLTNFAGEQVALRALFPSGDPPSGAADCAAPRLLNEARTRGLTPLALAEFWWGGAPPGGARVEGQTYPACREKCGPVLPFLLRGLNVAERRVWQPPARAPGLDVVLRDETFLVIDKPEGLLSVPARDEGIVDDVETRVRALWPDARCVHRLDLDTSGLLLIARDVDTYRLLQQQFLSRSVEKEYVAVVGAVLAADEGLIELPLSPDLDLRPLQKVDREHGKSAVTRWRVLERMKDTTRVALEPLTGRTHQLRLHAAHANGLGAPIVGDGLYGGRAAERLLLHAARLRFRHPLSGDIIEVARAAQFE